MEASGGRRSVGWTIHVSEVKQWMQGNRSQALARVIRGYARQKGLAKGDPTTTPTTRQRFLRQARATDESKQHKSHRPHTP